MSQNLNQSNAANPSGPTPNRQEGMPIEHQALYSIMATLQQMLQEQRTQASAISKLQQESNRAAAITPAGSHLASVVKPIKPDVFRGERTAAGVEAWLYSLEKYAEFVGIDEDSMVTFAQTLLRDSAAVWWRQVETDMELETPTTWNEFKKVFRKEFKPDNAEQLARTKLGQLKQTGTIEAYIREFRTIMLELPNMDTKDAMHIFIQGLKYQARLQVHMRLPKTLNEAYAYAEAYETAQQSARGVFMSVPQQPSAGTPFGRNNISRTTISNGPVPMELDAIRPSRKDTRKCFRCGQQGHLKRNCPKSHNKNQQGSNQQDFGTARTQ